MYRACSIDAVYPVTRPHKAVLVKLNLDRRQFAEERLSISLVLERHTYFQDLIYYSGVQVYPK